MAKEKIENTILGIDIGNCNVKTSVGISFPAQISSEVGIGSNDNIVMFDGKNMTIGYGEYETELDKTSKENLLPLLYEAIRRSTSANNVKIVIGLPIGQFKNNKAKLEAFIMKNNEKRIGSRNICIEDVRVVPEGATALYNISKEDMARIGDKNICIVDIGGRTTDLAYMKMVNGKRIIDKYMTVNVGVFKIYQDMIEHIYDEYVQEFKLEDAEGILNNGLYINDPDVEEPMDFLKEIVYTYFKEIVKNMNLKFNMANTYLYVTGGGSKLFKPFFVKFKGTIISENAILDNALSYRKVGKALWEKN